MIGFMVSGRDTKIGKTWSQSSGTVEATGKSYTEEPLCKERYKGARGAVGGSLGCEGRRPGSRGHSVWDDHHKRVMFKLKLKRKWEVVGKGVENVLH